MSNPSPPQRVRLVDDPIACRQRPKLGQGVGPPDEDRSVPKHHPKSPIP